MKVSECGTEFDLENCPSIGDFDAQGRMIKRQIDFQTLIGGYDPRLKDFGSKTYCQPFKAMHHLDMAVQETSEAWDMVEGGWKHHKTKPEPPDVVELLMELVDVYHFVINAYLFMGGQPEAEMVAAAVNRGNTGIHLQSMEMDYFWELGKRLYQARHAQLHRLFGYGEGAHGQPWEAEVAMRINFTRVQLTDVIGALRSQMEAFDLKVNGFKFPAASGFVYHSVVPPLFGAAAAIPGVRQEQFFHAFMHKNQINFDRQKSKY